jgi:hypothetical protein
MLGIEAFTANLVDVLLGILQAPTTVRTGGQPPVPESTRTGGRPATGRG